MKIYFAKNLKFLRERKGLDQQALADKLNIPRSTLSCWENGIRTPKIEQIQEIADYFGVDIDIVSKDYSDITIPNKISDSKETLKKILKDKGILGENDNISQEDFERLIKFIENNKDLLIKK